MTATSPGGTTMFGNEDIANQKLINSAINLVVLEISAKRI